MAHEHAPDVAWIATLAGTAGAALVLLYAARQMGLSGTGPRQQPGPRPVRDAGRDQMTMPPRQWDQMDEALDASFPASDPPGNY